MGRGTNEDTSASLSGRRSSRAPLDVLVERARKTAWLQPDDIDQNSLELVLAGDEVVDRRFESKAALGRDVHRPGPNVRAQLELLLQVGEAALAELETSPLNTHVLREKGKLDRLRSRRGQLERAYDKIRFDADDLAADRICTLLAEHGWEPSRGPTMLLLEIPAGQVEEFVRPIANFYGVRTPATALPLILAAARSEGIELRKQRLRQPDAVALRKRRSEVKVYEQAMKVNRLAQQQVSAVIARFRPLGGVQLPLPPLSHRDHIAPYKQLCEAAKLLPGDWAAASHEFLGERRLVAGVGHGRGSYTGVGRRAATVSYGLEDHGFAEAVLTHELVHHFEEARPALMVAQWAFWQKRVRGGDFDGPLAPLKKLYEIGDGNYDELYRDGGFDNDYTAKSYGGDWKASYELLSSGLERLLWPVTNVKSDMRRLPVTHDREYAAFLLGSLICL